MVLMALREHGVQTEAMLGLVATLLQLPLWLPIQL
jgi:hypothetical protein